MGVLIGSSWARRWPLGAALLVFVLAGQTWAATSISGKVTAPEGTSLTDVGAAVVATNDKFQIFRATPNDDGTYSIDIPENGTYRVAVVARGLAADPVKDIVLSDSSPTGTADLTLKERAPLCIPKSASPIPLTEGIDSAAFQNALEIVLNNGESLVQDVPTTWTGPTSASGRFKLMYSSAALHIAGDVTFKTPRVNNTVDAALHGGNAFELYFQNDKYDPTRTAYDKDHDWQLVVSLGDKPDWWLFGGVGARPGETLDSHFAIQDKPTKDGETFRLDVPWSVFVDTSGNGISPPADNDLGALDIALNAADPDMDRTTATRAYQLAWSGFNDMWTNPSSFMPIQFCPAASPPPAQ